jgi:hypothetical protein
MFVGAAWFVQFSFVRLTYSDNRLYHKLDLAGKRACFNMPGLIAARVTTIFLARPNVPPRPAGDDLVAQH